MHAPAAHVKQGDRRSGHLCPFYLHGTCKHGPQCRFSHDSVALARCDCPELCEAFPGGDRNVHTLRSSELVGNESLLGSISNFCAAFYHMADTPEANLRHGCLREGAALCRGKATVAVAVLAQQGSTDWRDVYVARYKNCCSGARCAEDALFADERLAHAIRSHGDLPQSLRIWINKQPCHKSSSTRPGWSCTEELVTFQARHNIPIELVVCYPYRAHWDARSVPRAFGPSIDNARAGLRILREAPGLRLRACQATDWDFLVGLCDVALQRDYHAALPVHFSPELRSKRDRMDSFVASCLSERAWWLVQDSEVGLGG